MRNRPSNDHMNPDNDASGQSFQVDRLPGVRVFLLGLLLLVPLLAVSGRLIFIQYMNAEYFYSQFGKTTESFEPIPSRDGRIVSIDGQVLARDVEHFNLQVHYRWLEEPPNPRWLKRQALKLLESKDRRNKEKVESAKEKFLDRRQQLWDELAVVMQKTPDELKETRRKTQKRVETIIENVNQRADQAQSEIPVKEVASNFEMEKKQDHLTAFWKLLKETLTTPPRRIYKERIIVREELDYHTVVQGIPREIALAISAHPERFPGIHIQVATRREYPQKTIAPHEIGIRHRIDDQTLAARKNRFPEGDPLDYEEGDRIGKMGIERSYDRHLRGLRGLRRVIKDRQGEIVRTEVIREPKSGDDVVLTLNTQIQGQLQNLLDQTLDELGKNLEQAESTIEVSSGGCIVVLDVRTGAVVATVSAPRYDLNLLLNPTPAEWQAVLNNPKRPLFPRATQMMLPPGSTFKALTSIALLENGKIDPDEFYSCRGYLDRPDRHRDYIYRHFGVGHNDINLTHALSQSCNVYFFQAARRMGPKAIFHWADQLGFGKPTGIDIPGERGGHLPDPSPKKDKKKKSRWYPGDTLGVAIGQSRLTVTPLQIARLMAVVANDGEMIVPHLAHSIVPSSESSTTTRQMISHPRRYVSGIHPGTLERVREGLINVVAHPRGTGYKTVRLKEITIAGKTGTAETGGGKNDHAWFAGFVPAERPKYAFAVVIEHGGSGSKVAGPVAQKLVKLLLETRLLSPTQVKLQAN